MIRLFKLALVLIFFSSFQFTKRIEQISMASEIRTLRDGKVITLRSYVYYKKLGGEMVVHFNYPLEELIFTNSRGEYKQYNPKANTVYLAEGYDYSSKSNFLNHFLNYQTQDMGLREANYSLEQNSVEENMLVTKWKNAQDPEKVMEAKLVHEKSLPIFQSTSLNGNYLNKTYYSDYKDVGGLTLPMRITEINFVENGDSVITKRQFSDVKINEFVNGKYFDYPIPSNAKLLKSQGFGN